MSFLSRIFSGFGKWFGRAYNKVKPFLKKEIPAVIEAVNEAKVWIDSPILDILSAAFKSKWGADVTAKLRAAIPVALAKLDVAKNISNIDDPIAFSKAVMAEIKKLDTEGRHDSYFKLSQLLLEQLTDGKLDRSEKIIFLEAVYKEFYMDK